MSQSALTRRRFVTIAASAFGVAMLGRVVPSRASEPVRWRGSALGAQVSIEIHHPDCVAAERLVERSVRAVHRLEQMFSLYRPDSAICALNRSGVLIAPDRDVVALLQTTLDFAAQTGGAFDPTVQPLWELYRRHFERTGADPSGPAKADVAGALAKVGYDGVLVSADRIALKRPGAAITLNGIAQGFATDRVVDLLRKGGMTSTLVDIGEIRAIGARPDGVPWRVGLADPETTSANLGTVDLVDRAVATSSGAGFRFDPAGQFTHLFDPSTGRSPSLYRSVSVVAPTATEADALSTAFSMLDRGRIGTIVQARAGVEVLLAHAEGSVQWLRG
ncbi:FAD:protein FMN transferase [Rhodopseudomonas palustris]|uniref:FAD:protein FMN transferase n=1 Tax=Rhodopseudomonas palustris (strain ATCC BAA-98 / CGA009) TaxID=258594 RepID=Q6N838_RHOPA|nr:FAD:protein FMN transferase [Rhodopseudomonas palustris]OPF90647.1 thiamine biosynthesis protein ApbE [Rhodopseudomonas palustris]PPQ43073.1 FAD:protein FMN transferase [Rhodopseudomonas palustris]QQM03577.1 FAD:protein FMN transferase [Rhodopseudomonas palustris]RJF61673.1 FAD:protein FMN transferase [Rhodopseudomonas palustris]WAB79723.1 FAD:protein FMN transferase [Rhodopseudomonas palustris]